MYLKTLKVVYDQQYHLSFTSCTSFNILATYKYATQLHDVQCLPLRQPLQAQCCHLSVDGRSSPGAVFKTSIKMSKPGTPIFSKNLIIYTLLNADFNSFIPFIASNPL